MEVGSVYEKALLNHIAKVIMEIPQYLNGALQNLIFYRSSVMNLFLILSIARPSDANGALSTRISPSVNLDTTLEAPCHHSASKFLL
jgi:hypothetical protein